MIILDEPFASDLLLDWCAQSGHPVLDNEFSRTCAQRYGLNLVDGPSAAARLEEGERVYTNSENALEWILDSVENENLVRAIRTFKDKALMRRVLASVGDDSLIATMPDSELDSYCIDGLELPFVLKPVVGFCSMGVYVISSKEDWRAAVADIARQKDIWAERYPQSVVGVQEFMLERYIGGQEYALDAYLDSDGRAHMLNVLRHDFASQEDTSDRMYVTSPEILQEMGPLFTAWLDSVNEVLGIVNVPLHIEVRVEGDAVRAIEFNPLRFAGLSGTDIAYRAYGFRTYEAFLTDSQPDFQKIFEDCQGSTYCMSLLGIPAGATGCERFDDETFRKNFTYELDYLPFDAQSMGSYGFLFLRTDESTQGELDYLLRADLREFLTEGPCA